MEGWRYYNHAMIPTAAPHEIVKTTCVQDESIWEENKNAFLARWTTDFDCGHETNWWYVIKDTPFDISALKSKRRYTVNKGIKNFTVKEIDPSEHACAIADVRSAAITDIPKKYRVSFDKEEFVQDIKTWRFYKVYGAFDNESGMLCAYAILSRMEKYISFDVLKSVPESESKGVNAATVAQFLTDHAAFFTDGGYICDGARNILHETHFQDYLEKYFGFRKAYCKLHVAYNPKIAWAVKLLYPFRRILKMFGGIGIVHKINGILDMESITREGNKDA